METNPIKPHLKGEDDEKSNLKSSVAIVTSPYGFGYGIPFWISPLEDWMEVRTKIEMVKKQQLQNEMSINIRESEIKNLIFEPVYSFEMEDLSGLKQKLDALDKKYNIAEYMENVSKMEILDMNLAKHHIYLIFDIQNQFIQKVGEVQILIHKESDLKKWINPELVKQDAIDYFKQENPKFKEENLNAFFTGELVPFV